MGLNEKVAPAMDAGAVGMEASSFRSLLLQLEMSMAPEIAPKVNMIFFNMMDGCLIMLFVF